MVYLEAVRLPRRLPIGERSGLCWGSSSGGEICLLTDLLRKGRDRNPNFTDIGDGQDNVLSLYADSNILIDSVAVYAFVLDCVLQKFPDGVPNLTGDFPDTRLVAFDVVLLLGGAVPR